MTRAWSSGDLLADRRFAYAESLESEGDVAAAVDLYQQTVERAAAWAPAWLSLGLALERTGDRGAARIALARAADLDRAGVLGAAVHLARLDGIGPRTIPTAYVAALFDDYAPRFDDHLLGGLGYCGPQLVADQLQLAHPGRTFRRGLDLGCGTGLMAGALERCVLRMDGVDISAAMLARARSTGLYGMLAVGELTEVLAAAPAAAYDLVVAADVFVYLGDLGAVLHGARRALETGGALAFTTQRAESTEGADVTLGADLRFSHVESYVRDAVRHAGFRIDAALHQSTRREGGAAVPGLVVTATAT